MPSGKEEGSRIGHPPPPSDDWEEEGHTSRVEMPSGKEEGPRIGHPPLPSYDWPINLLTRTREGLERVLFVVQTGSGLGVGIGPVRITPGI